MVLFKRKPVQFAQVPVIDDENSEVWHIAQTGELFVAYEDYLNRMEFYSQHRFICPITGHSGLTFFAALKSELAGAQEVEQAFPEALKGPVLRRVQFQTISRIDTLVDMIYDEFKADYYPGEAVTIHLGNGERLTGVVRDKARLGSKVLPDGTLSHPYSRYFTSIDGRPADEAVVDENHIFRDRKVFTKSVLRSFIKKTVTREAWNGAPWLVKHDVAHNFHIDTRVPPHLRYDNKLLERKQTQAQKKAFAENSTSGSRSPEANGSGTPGSSTNMLPARLPELKPAPKSHRTKTHAANHVWDPVVPPGPGMNRVTHEPGYMPGTNPYQYAVAYREQMPPPPPVVPSSQQEHPPQPPPIKYPIEDLQVEPRDDYVRPALKFMCSDPPEGVVDSSARNNKILMKSIGPLLETWVTLNVYCEVFKLDSFTFDDFVEALEITTEDLPCQLFTEIHCAVLKQLVSSQTEGGKLQIILPELVAEVEVDEDIIVDEIERNADESTVPTPEPQLLPKPRRATRSSLAKAEAEAAKLQADVSEPTKDRQPDSVVKHRAMEAQANFEWIEHLKKRDFKNGGWEMIMVGLLHQLSKNPRQSEACETLLAQLVPADLEPTRENIRRQYYTLDLNLRVQALQIICMLTTGTKAVRGYMEECAETMTTYRKEKIEWQRQKKQAIEDLKALHEQRKIMLPDNTPPSPKPASVNGDVKMTDADETVEEVADEAAGSEDESQIRRNTRRGGERATERQRKREEQERKKVEAELAVKAPKQSKQFTKILKEIKDKEDTIQKCETEIGIIDNDLREADCGRTKVLGKDRFWNRYYWFERNGMPYAGLPNSSTADAGYANGCIWVQGPDELERQGYIDLKPEHQAEYKAKFNMTVAQRKKMEEGRTSVFTAYQWGYYSDPKDLDALLNWLDPRGFNEFRLRKEMTSYRNKIVTNMENREKYLTTPDEGREEKKEEPVKDTKVGGRMSTRAKTQPSPERPAPYRCLKWVNTTMLDEVGWLHSDEPPAKAGKKGARKPKR